MFVPNVSGQRGQLLNFYEMKVLAFIRKDDADAGMFRLVIMDDAYGVLIITLNFK